MKLFDEAIVRLYLRASSLDDGNCLMDRDMASRHQIRCDYGGAPRDAHITVNQNVASVVQGLLDEATCVREVDKDVIVFRVLHGYNHVVRPLQRIVLARRNNVRDPKLSAEVDGLDGGEISDVELTIDDGVDVAGGCIRHDQGMVV